MIQKLRYFLLTKSVGFGLNLLSYVLPQKSARIAYQLFSHPRKGRREELPRFLADAQQSPIEIDQKKVHVYEWKNSGDKVFLVHGWESNAYRWIGLIQFLRRKKYHVIAIDAPAQGLSDGYELNPIMYSKAIDQVCQQYSPKIMIGHSFGGFTSLYYQSVYQNSQLAKMVVMGSPNRFEKLLTNYRELLSLSNRSYQKFLNVFRQDFSIDIQQYSAEEFISKIKQPILWIHDKTDRVVEYRSALQVQSKHPKVTLFTTKNLGHSLYHQSVYKEIYQFITE